MYTLIFFSLFVGEGKLLRYMLTDDTTSYTRLTFHEMYEQENIDVLFIGSSHCYRSFIPSILDIEMGGVNSFNCGTSSQALDGSFVILKEAAKYNKLKHVYLEVYFNVGFTGNYKDRSQMTQTYIIADYLRPSFEKVRYMFNASSKEHYLNSFIVARRNWEKLYDIDYIRNLLQKKNTEVYKKYKYNYVTWSAEWYAGKGYVASAEQVDEWNYFQRGVLDGQKFDDLAEDWYKSLDEIITFCDKEKIPLTLVSAPMSNYYLASLEYYDDYINLIGEIATEAEIEYLDFNLCKEEFIPNSSEIFKDVDHLNNKGAEIFSHVFADYYNGYTDDSIFYESYADKLSKLNPSVFGIVYQDENETSVRHCKIITSSEDIECKIELMSEAAEYQLVQAYSKNRFFDIESTQHGVCTITYRVAGKAEESIKIVY